MDSTPSALVKAQETDGDGDGEVAPEAEDEAGGSISFTEARINIERIRLKLPETLDCEEIDFELEDSECGPPTDDSSTLLGLVGFQETDGEEDGEEDGDDDSEDADDDEDNIKIDGPFIYNMLTGLSSPDFSETVIPSGTYRRIELRFTNTTLVEASDSLFDHAMVIGGTYDDGASIRSFLISIKFNEWLRFENEAGIEITESADINAIVVELDVNNWFNGVDLGACFDSGRPDVSDDGVLIVNRTNDGGECNFTDELKKNIKASGRVEKEDDVEDDGDEDGEEDGDGDGDEEE